MGKKAILITWAVRVAMFIGISVQNSKVADITINYLSEVTNAESAVQASQLSGEMALLGFSTLAGLIVTIVFWVMVELTMKEFFNRKKVTNGSV